MIIKKTYSELFIYNQVGGAYLQKNPENKVSAAIIKFADKQLKQIFTDYEDELDNLRLNNCLVDEKTRAVLHKERKLIDANGKEIIVMDRQFSPEGEIKLKGEIKELNKVGVDVHSRILDGIDDLIKLMTDEEKEAFSEIFIPKQVIND